MSLQVAAARKFDKFGKSDVLYKTDNQVNTANSLFSFHQNYRLSRNAFSASLGPYLLPPYDFRAPIE